MVRFVLVELYSSQKTPGAADVYEGNVSALNPVLVIVYNAAEYVDGNRFVGVGMVYEVPEMVTMFVRHSVGAKMRKLFVGATWMFPR
jgi:hypothetical protein